MRAGAMWSVFWSSAGSVSESELDGVPLKGFALKRDYVLYLFMSASVAVAVLLSAIPLPFPATLLSFLSLSYGRSCAALVSATCSTSIATLLTVPSDLLA